MKYTPYARQITGKCQERDARIKAFYEEMVERIDLKKLPIEALRDRMGFVMPS